jgi:hypothetical protein
MKMRNLLIMFVFMFINLSAVFSEDIDIPKNNTPVFVTYEQIWLIVNEQDIGKATKEIKDWKQLFFGNKVTLVNNKKFKDVVYFCVQLPDKTKGWGRYDYFTSKFITITAKDVTCYSQPDASYKSKIKLQPGFLGYYQREENGFILVDFPFWKPKKTEEKPAYLGKLWIQANNDIYSDDINLAAEADMLTTAYSYLYNNKESKPADALKTLKKALELNQGDETVVSITVGELISQLESGGVAVTTEQTKTNTTVTSTETSVGKYYMPSVDTLRFRETPAVDGKIIRSLQNGERLKLIEKGKADTVNGTKGYWCKFETSKGETGWCFDGYLEEYK